jgi:hypothetical protein
MSSSPPQSASLEFEPSSVYLVFVVLEGETYPGVFHHNKDNEGVLVYASAPMLGAQTPGAQTPGAQTHKPQRYDRDILLEPRQSKSRIAIPACARLTFIAIRDRKQISHRRCAQSGESTLP